jgi:hypothetical protein
VNRLDWEGDGISNHRPQVVAVRGGIENVCVIHTAVKNNETYDSQPNPVRIKRCHYRVKSIK